MLLCNDKSMCYEIKMKRKFCNNLFWRKTSNEMLFFILLSACASRYARKQRISLRLLNILQKICYHRVSMMNIKPTYSYWIIFIFFFVSSKLIIYAMNIIMFKYIYYYIIVLHKKCKIKLWIKIILKWIIHLNNLET